MLFVFMGNECPVARNLQGSDITEKQKASKGGSMALLMVQPGYGSVTCRYPAQRQELPEVSFEEVACRLELAMGLFSGEKEEEPLEGDGTEETEEKPCKKTLAEEEWEDLLEQLNVVEDVLQTMLEQEKQEEEQENLEEALEETMLSLTEESTWSTPETEEEEETGVSFLTWYTKKGIYCRKIGGKKKEQWKIRLFTPEEYEKVLLFLRRFPEEWSLLFAANQEFWLDFLDNDFDEDGFVAYMEGKNKEAADCSTDIGNSEILQRNGGNWSEYLNLSGGSAGRNIRRNICLTCEVECNRKRRLE